MSEWIRPTRYFGGKAVLLTIPRCEADNLGLEGLKDNPDEYEAVILPLIAKHRPELVGGVLLGIRFDYMRFMFQALYEHHSLPRTPEGDVFCAMPLIPEDEPSVIVES